MSRKYSKEGLLLKCHFEIEQQILVVNELFSTNIEEVLITSPLPGKWSSKQCLEHLNATLELYLPRITKALDFGAQSAKDDLRHGIIGYKFWTSMVPNGIVKTKTMKTFRSLNPGVTGESCIDVVMRFAVNMRELDDCLDKSRDRNIQKLRVVSAAGRILKLRIGDVFPFLLNHNLRHIRQAAKSVEVCKLHK